MTYKKSQNKIRRHRKIRTKLSGTLKVPRLSIYRSNRAIYAQIVDDASGKTLLGLNGAIQGAGNKVARSREMGEEFAKKALSSGIKKIIFDRGGYKYHGRIKAFAEGARKCGLKF